ncbi:MAG: hypothetical protein NTZ17_19920 [Phycisphaerae bacterium]|nr:hypothetical protein [Phycisphaerae bacterium]
MDSSKSNLADPESLLGMLQRGRGRGFLAALEAAPETVWPLLLECITHDPRLDRQCENRAEYYAGLIADVGMSLESLQHHLKQNDAREIDLGYRVNLPLETLVCMAQRGSLGAAEVLRDYVSFGKDWAWIVMFLGELDAPAALEGIDEVLCRRMEKEASFRESSREDIENACSWYYRLYVRRETESLDVPLPMREPWKTLSQKNPDFAQRFADLGATCDPPSSRKENFSEEYLAGLSLVDLFSLVDESNRITFWRILPEKVSPEDEDYLLHQLAMGDPHRMILAFRGLGELGTPRAFDAVKAYIEGSKNADRKVRLRAVLAIEEMPGSLTLNTARQWFRRREHHLQIPAGGILENHATLEDVPLLIEALRTAETLRGEDFRLSSALDALARFDGFGWIPELEQVFCEAQDCFWRYRAANAMAATAPVEFASEYAFECLWDCHDDTRALGCETVSLSTPGVLERLREIAEDAVESNDVQQAAANRLEGL